MEHLRGIFFEARTNSCTADRDEYGEEGVPDAAISPIWKDHSFPIGYDIGVINFFVADGLRNPITGEVETHVFNFGLKFQKMPMLFG